MSSITLSPNASGTAIFTVAAPGTSTNQTLTLPDASTTLVGTDATQTLTNKSIAGSQITGDVAAAQITTALNAGGSAPIYACRAWVSFTGSSGAIIGSGNVGSVTRNAAGAYTINFTTAMPDTNYCITGVSSGSTTGSTSISADGASGDFIRNTTSVKIYTVDASGNAAVDAVSVYVAIFR
jgi:hypothetical protein